MPKECLSVAYVQRGDVLGVVRQEHVAVVGSDDAQQVAGATVAVLRPPPPQQADRALVRDPGGFLKVLGADCLLVPLHTRPLSGQSRWTGPRGSTVV